MKIIIAGAGEVGNHLAKQLSIEEHDITVIDVDPERLERVNSSTDVLTMQGSATSISTLKDANISNTDLLVAVTSTETININTAILAKKMGAKRTVARVGNAEYVCKEHREMFASLGIDYLIYPEELAAYEVVKLIERSSATDIIEFQDGKISLIGVKLDKDSPIINKSMRDLSEQNTGSDFRIVAVHRGVKTLIPSGDTKLLANDQVFVFTTPAGLNNIVKITGKEHVSMNDIMILGGGKIGRMVAKMLEDKRSIKIIESNKNKSLDLADQLQRSLVIQGDGRDIDLLAQEGIIDMNGFISVTSNAETNIITSLMAKHLGVPKTIALVDNVDYIPLTQTIGLDSLINKKLIAANNITRFIRKSNIVSTILLQGIDAEVLEYVVQPGSQITKKPVRDLKFPKDAILGGYIRGGKGNITVGNTHFEPNDKVVVFALPGLSKKVEKFFD